MEATISLSTLDNKKIIVTFTKNEWRIQNLGEVLLFLPKTLSYVLKIGNEKSESIELFYENKKPNDIDYPWILLIKTLENEIKSITIDRQNSERALCCFRIFFKYLFYEIK